MRADQRLTERRHFLCQLLAPNYEFQPFGFSVPHRRGFRPTRGDQTQAGVLSSAAHRAAASPSFPLWAAERALRGRPAPTALPCGSFPRAGLGALLLRRLCGFPRAAPDPPDQEARLRPVGEGGLSLTPGRAWRASASRRLSPTHGEALWGGAALRHPSGRGGW